MKMDHCLIYLFLAALLSCGEKPAADKSSATELILDSDGSKLAKQFDADAADTRLVILLSPT